MKILVAADLHGNVEYTKKLTQFFEEGRFQKMYLLGDILRDSILLLNPYHDRIVAVKGNCDTELEEDTALFSLPYLNFDSIDGKFTVMTHGHYYSSGSYDQPYDIFLEAHTHVSRIIRNRYGAIIANPGSIARPRDGHHSVMVIHDQDMSIIDIDTKAILWQTQI